MATYKVLQDIEAEDKLLGPLTLRQFIYAAVAAICLYLTYFLSTHGAAIMSVVMLPMALIAGFFAFPWGRDQPTELWALAKIRFILKPHRRIWDQSGLKELVTVTAPKKEAVDYSNGLSQTEVKSRLSALADTLDSHGWAIKNTNINIGVEGGGLAQSDRLVNPVGQPRGTDVSDVQAADDILDERNNPNARRLGGLVEASARSHRQQIIQDLNKPAAATPAKNYWFLDQPAQPASIPSDMVTFNTQVVTPGAQASEVSGVPAATPDERLLVQQLATQQQGVDVPMSAYYAHLRKIQPLSAQKPPVPKPARLAAPRAPEPVPTPPETLVNLSHNNDLNVETIARQAQPKPAPAEPAGGSGEVVVSLH